MASSLAGIFSTMVAISARVAASYPGLIFSRSVTFGKMRGGSTLLTIGIAAVVLRRRMKRGSVLLFTAQLNTRRSTLPNANRFGDLRRSTKVAHRQRVSAVAVSRFEFAVGTGLPFCAYDSDAQRARQAFSL